MIKENQRALNAIMVVLDWVCMLIGLALAYIIRFSFFSADPNYLTFPYYLWLLIYIFPAYTIFGQVFGLYRSKRSNRLRGEFITIIKINVAGIISLLVLLYLLHLNDYSRLCMFLYALLLTGIMSLQRAVLRLALRALRKKGYNLKYILLVGSGKMAKAFVAKVRKNPNFGYRFSGVLLNSADSKSFFGVPVLGDYAALSDTLKRLNIDEVVVALELTEYEKLQDIIACCEKSGIKLHIVPAFFEYIPSRPYWGEFDGLPVMTLRRIPLSNPINAAFKRMFDIAVSLLAIILSWPVMLAVAVVIRASTGERPIYRQERLGLNCRPFIMYKFRSMKSGADEAPSWTKKQDPRRTGFGAFIRRLSVDELPQFFNVLIGEMSVVGPRPEVKRHADRFAKRIPRYMVKHQVKPGITGLAQVQGLRGNTSIKERIRQDIYYIENWSLPLDIKIVLKTITNAFYNHNE